MSLSYDYWTGHINLVLESLKRSLTAYTRADRPTNHFKVGVTTNPEDRWKAHRRDGWDRMVCKYKTSSRSYAIQVEQYLIRHGWENIFYAESWNQLPGGENVPHDQPTYYIYFLLSEVQ